MKPDDTMPLDGNAFFSAVEGYSKTVQLAYLRALWKYWNHTHCSGLPDEDDYLRKICDCEQAEWARTKPIIFGSEFFFQKNGTHWHQKGAKERHRQQTELYQKRVILAENARSAKTITGINHDTNPDNKLTQAQIVLFSKEYERVIEQMAQIDKTYGGLQKWSEKDRENYKKLKLRRDELRTMLGIKT